jgi:anti-sigma-K factor RskA
MSNAENWQDDRERDDELSQLFAAYREACPETDGSTSFLAGVWQKIERRQSFWFSFEQFARQCAAFAVAVCLLLVALNIAASRQAAPLPGGYVDALAVDHSAERTYYAEGVHTNSSPAELTPNSGPRTGSR